LPQGVVIEAVPLFGFTRAQFIHLAQGLLEQTNRSRIVLGSLEGNSCLLEQHDFFLGRGLVVVVGRLTDSGSLFKHLSCFAKGRLHGLLLFSAQLLPILLTLPETVSPMP
jgi:hypothetical protein